MADLTIPKGQTFPIIRGYVADEEGALDLTTASEVLLIVNATVGGDPLELTVDPVDPPESMTVNGQTIPVNWSADIVGSTLTDDEATWDKCKLKITWSVGLIQYCPQTGFIEIVVGPNVTEPA